MNQCRNLAVLATLLVAVFANAAEKNIVRIKILDSKTNTSTTTDNGVPRNCDLSNYDAYCHGTREADVANILLVQEGDAPPYLVRCTNESKWSRCAAFPKGETLDARKEKHGITIYYLDEKGKLRKQSYTYVADDGNGNPLPASLRSAKKPSAARPTAETQPNPTPTEDAAQDSSSAASAANSPQDVKCTFSSTPSGADITLDGKYVGSTPSVIDVGTGKHVVAVTMPGFDPWKRDLTVSPGSELTVNAVLQKTQ